MLDIATVLNGNILSAKSCSFFFDGIPRRGLVAVNYKEKLDVETVYDDSPDGAGIGSTSGRYAVESFSMTFLKAAWAATGPIPGIMQYLTLKGLGSYGSARFSFTAEYSEPLNPLATVVDTLAPCRIIGVEDDYSEDIKALVTKVDLHALLLVRQGTNTLFDPKRAIGL